MMEVQKVSVKVLRGKGGEKLGGAQGGQDGQQGPPDMQHPPCFLHCERHGPAHASLAFLEVISPRWSVQHLYETLRWMSRA